MADRYRLRYNGTLSRQTADYIRTSTNDGYTFWVELSYYPENFHEWADREMKKAYMVQGNDIEGYSSGWHTLFCIVRRSFLTSTDDSVVFCGFRNQHDYDRCVANFSNIVVNVNPFETIF